MSEVLSWTLAEARDALSKGEVSSVELVDAHIKAMEAARALNCFITETPEAAREAAKAADLARSEGNAPALAGIPFANKDLFCTHGVQTTAASHILEGFVPQYDSTVGENLQKAGMISLGKTNLDEFAMGSSNETSYFGHVKNPWRLPDGTDTVPGGSSGGSVAAVAAGIGYGATGTDTGGSIRQPASFTGTVGLKPTYGRCSRWGIVAFASSLDQAGPIAKTVRDAAIMLEAMAGYDPKDSTSVNRPVPNYEAALTGDIRGMKIGIPSEYRMDGAPEEIDALWEQGKAWLKDAGAELVDISLPHTKYALPTYYIVAPAEASSNLARYDGVRYGLREMRDGGGLVDMYSATRAAGFGREVKRRVLIGTYVLSAGYYDAYYLKAQKVRTLIARDFAAAFENVDTILTPSTPSAAFAFGAKSDDPISMYLNDIFTVPANLAGLPGISVPSGMSAEGLPLGLQLLAPAFGEETLLRTADVLERQAGFSARPSRWWED